VFVDLNVALRPGELAKGVTTTQPATKEVVRVAEQKALMGGAEEDGSEGSNSCTN
jgi:hypothetical protein